jgi:hypothetical protein
MNSGKIDLASGHAWLTSTLCVLYFMLQNFPCCVGKHPELRYRFDGRGKMSCICRRDSKISYIFSDIITHRSYLEEVESAFK